MTGKNYTDEKNVQIVVAMLKAHGIKRIIASPGTTNLTFVASLQCDPFFEMYSAPDERSAAYMACGIAAESGEPVVLTCTGATASRNYLPGLTEAYYRKLPILAVTATQPLSSVGHLVPQVIDRSTQPADTVVESVVLPTVKDNADFAACEVAANKAFLALTHRGGGPVHINLVTTYSPNFDVKELPKVRVVRRYTATDTLPELKGTVGIFVGAHRVMSPGLTAAIDAFCDRTGAIVYCDHTSNYYGRHRFLYPHALSQRLSYPDFAISDVLIHIGEVAGSYASPRGRRVWRVSEDGALRFTFGGLEAVFEMPEQHFFEYYSSRAEEHPSRLDQARALTEQMSDNLPELPFSNPWVAGELAERIPAGSVVHLGILNSLRSWNFYEFGEEVETSCNVGGFGIDGSLSTVLGASLVHPDKLYFCMLGDLAFFYDMNSLGNRHVGRNLRILLINNGKGTEFRQYNHPCHRFGEYADEYMSAAGHYGDKSPDLVRHYAEDLGFEYLSAHNKEEFAACADRFVDPTIDRPIIFEVFTTNKDESAATEAMQSMLTSTEGVVRSVANRVLGTKGRKIVKGILNHLK